VELDLSKGLLPNPEVVWKSWTFIQKLDYWKIPFRCSECREIGHLRRCCPGGPSNSRRRFSPSPTSVNPSPSVMVSRAHTEESVVELEIHKRARMKTHGTASGQITPLDAKLLCWRF
jgi:hypothetical protein